MNLLEQCRENLKQHNLNRYNSDVLEMIEFIENKLLKISENGQDSVDFIFQVTKDTYVKHKNIIKLYPKSELESQILIKNVADYFENIGFECYVNNEYNQQIYFKIKFYDHCSGKLKRQIEKISDRTYGGY